MKIPPKETVAFDPPDEEEDMKTEVSTNQKEKQHLVKELMSTSDDKQDKTLYKSHERGNDRSAETSRTSLEDYRTRYLQSVRFRERTNFTMSADTLQVLRNILQDLGERVSMACYIDNILREHFKEHKELLNNATAKHRRKVAIDF